jgi:2-oxoglutarate dehydrogenase E2 component (dihydrolipoamide succinyltransferase)
MGNFEIVMPQMGEGLIEATLTRWLKQEGELVTEDDAVVEVATDKVDTEISSPVSGILIKKLFSEGDVVPIGTPIALVELQGQKADTAAAEKPAPVIPVSSEPVKVQIPAPLPNGEPEHVAAEEEYSGGTRFYSPLVKNIARQENVSMTELSKIPGTGKDDRVTKEDLLNWVKNRKSTDLKVSQPVRPPVASGEDQVVEMDRIRQLISSHMSKSWETSPHVNSFMEVDMTRIANWREKNKDAFAKRENIKLTFTPVIIEAIARALRDLPQVNVSLDGTRIIYHKRINIGMAVALPNYNLIVPVIKNADQISLLGIIKSVTDLADRARKSKLVPDEISGGTVSFTNLGSFGLLSGTPIINQPQTAIVAAGVIKKRPVVLETPDGDTIAIRHMMVLSVAHDHRIIDGVLAGQFLDKMRLHLENFDITQSI